MPKVSAFMLTREERKAIFGGTLKCLKRPKKPDQEAGAEIVVSSTRGGKQVVERDRDKRQKLLDQGKPVVIDVPSQPRLRIVIKGWHLKAGNTEWETDIEIRDQREQNRVLANGIGGIPREPGLKTRWGQTVDSEGKVRPKRVPTKAEQHENWTPETERGYGGRNGMERNSDGDLVPSTGVDDVELNRFADAALLANLERRASHRKRESTMREEMKLAGEHRRARRQRARAQKLEVTALPGQISAAA